MTRDIIQISSLDPSSPVPSTSSIKALVTLLWPYSSSTQQCALLLADPDFRQRYRKGQVRARFSGPSAQAIAQSGIGIGDEVTLDLTGAQWAQDLGSQVVRTPGRSVDGELVFKLKLGLRLSKEGEVKTLHVDEQVDETPTEDVSRTPEPVQRPRAGLDLGGVAIYSSPAFSKRLRLSQSLRSSFGSSLRSSFGPEEFESPYARFVDEAGDEDLDAEKVRKRRRVSYKNVGEWRFSEQEVSPEKEQQDEASTVPNTQEEQDIQVAVPNTQEEGFPEVEQALQMEDAETDVDRTAVQAEAVADPEPQLEPEPDSTVLSQDAVPVTQVVEEEQAVTTEPEAQGEKPVSSGETLDEALLSAEPANPEESSARPATVPEEEPIPTHASEPRRALPVSEGEASQIFQETRAAQQQIQEQPARSPAREESPVPDPNNIEPHTKKYRDHAAEVERMLGKETHAAQDQEEGERPNNHGFAMLPPPLPRLQSDQPTTPVLEPVSSAKLPLPSPFPGFEGGQEIPDTYFHEKRHSSPAAVAKEVTRPEQADDAVQQPAVSHRPGVWNPEMGIRFTDPAASDQASGSRAHKQPSETGEATLQPLGDSLEAGAVEPSPSAGSEADVSDTMYDEDEIARLQQEDTIPEDEERDDELLGLLTESLKDEVAEGEFEYYNSATVSDQDDTDKVAHESDDSDEEMAEVEDMMKEISDDDGGDVEGDMDVHDYMLTGDARADYVEEDDPDPELGSMDSPTYDPETGSPSYWPSSGHPLGLDGAMGSKRAQAFSESVTARPDAAAAAGEVSPTSSEVAWDVMDAALVEVGKSSPVSARRLSAPSPASVDYSAQRPMPVVPASSPTETVRHPAVLPPTQRPVVPSSSNRRSENVDLGLDSEDEDEGEETEPVTTGPGGKAADDVHELDVPEITAGVTMGGPETPDVEAVNAGSAILDTLQPSPPSQRKETTFSGDATPLDTRSPLAGIIDDALDRDTVTSTPATPPAQTRDDTSPALENGPNTQGRHAENMRKVFPYGVPDANSRDIVEEHFPSTETARPLPSAIPEPSEPTSPISPIKTAQIAGHDVEMGDAEASVAMGSRILDLVQPRPPETNDARLLDPVSHTTDRLAPPSHDDANANFHRLSSTPARSPQSVRPIEEIDLSQVEPSQHWEPPVIRQFSPEAVIADSVDSPITTLVPGSSRPASREGGPDHAAVPVSAQEEDIQREEVTQEPLSRFHGQFSGLDQPSQLTMPSQELGTPFSDTAPPQVEQMEMINEDMQVDDDLLEVAASPERKVEDTGITETAGVGVVPRSVSQIAVAHDSALISELNGSRSPLVFTSTQQLTLEGIETEQNDFGPPSSTPQTAMATEQGADVERLGDVRSHNIDVDEQTVSYPDLAKSQSPDESQLKLETQAAFPLPEADEPIEDSQMEVEAQHPPAGTQPSEQPVVEQASAVSAQTPQRQPRLVARKSLTARLTEVPEVISAWFTPRRSSVRSAQTQEGATMTTPAGKGGQQSPSKGVRFSFVSHVSPPNPANIHRKSSITRSASPPPLSRGASQGISTSLSYFYPLTDLESQLNTPTSTIDILAVVTSASVEPTRAKAGPRDFYTLFHITDAAIYEQQNANGDEAALRKDVRVEVFRPWKASLPIASPGDVVLLRNFVVRSRDHRPYLLSSEASAWCVWRFAARDNGTAEKSARRRRTSGGGVAGAKEETKGPAVEVGPEEREKVVDLRGWWESVMGSAGQG